MFSRILLTTIFWLLPYSTALPSTPSLSNVPKRDLAKRVTRVLECDSRVKIPDYPDPGPIAENDPARIFIEEVKAFNSLTSLCGSYPSGMGYYCPPAGNQLLVQIPWSRLYWFLGPPNSQYLKDACENHCYCTSIAPDDPDPSAARPASAQCLAAVGESDSEDEIDAGGCMETFDDPEIDDGIICDAYMYGHPANPDCVLAQEGIGAGVDPLTETHEFLGIGAERVTTGYPIAQTPYNWTSGTCYIQLSMIEVVASSNLEDWDYIWGRVNRIREKCVAGLGVGGTTKAGRGGPDGGKADAIALFVSGVDSKSKQMLDLKYGCIADADGNYSCEDESGPPTKKQKTSDSGAASPPARLSGQSGPCAHYKDCDYRNGYTCAATKKARDGFPVDASWGTFACTLVSNVASGVVAAAAAYVALGSAVCHGRCLLDTNGTIDVLANTSTSTTSTGPAEPDSAMTAPILVTPCNCTYASPACAFASATDGLVFEDPSAKIDTVIRPANSTLCCDASTGLWRTSAVQRDAPAKDAMCGDPAAGSDSGSGSASVNTRKRHAAGSGGGGGVYGLDVVLT